MFKLQDQMNAIASSKAEKESHIRPRPTHLTSIQEETSAFIKEHIQKQKFRSTSSRKYLNTWYYSFTKLLNYQV